MRPQTETPERAGAWGDGKHRSCARGAHCVIRFHFQLKEQVLGQRTEVRNQCYKKLKSHIDPFKVHIGKPHV